jgi:hypothetical protein
MARSWFEDGRSRAGGRVAVFPSAGSTLPCNGLACRIGVVGGRVGVGAVRGKRPYTATARRVNGSAGRAPKGCDAVQLGIGRWDGKPATTGAEEGCMKWVTGWWPGGMGDMCANNKAGSAHLVSPPRGANGCLGQGPRAHHQPTLGAMPHKAGTYCRVETSLAVTAGAPG